MEILDNIFDFRDRPIQEYFGELSSQKILIIGHVG